MLKQGSLVGKKEVFRSISAPLRSWKQTGGGGVVIKEKKKCPSARSQGQGLPYPPEHPDGLLLQSLRNFFVWARYH